MKYLKNACLLATVVFLAACGSLENPDYEALEFPSYASGGFLEDVSVHCGNNIIIVSRHAMEQFYTEDDVLLTRKEFCETFRTGTYIHRS